MRRTRCNNVHAYLQSAGFGARSLALRLGQRSVRLLLIGFLEIAQEVFQLPAGLPTGLLDAHLRGRTCLRVVLHGAPRDGALHGRVVSIELLHVGRNVPAPFLLELAVTLPVLGASAGADEPERSAHFDLEALFLVGEVRATLSVGSKGVEHVRNDCALFLIRELRLAWRH